jgi:transcriptional regulator with GAF, ATPase, and Fis domain
VFCAPDSPQQPDGFAGLVWSTRGVVFLPGKDVAPVPQIQQHSAEGLQHEYCRSTFSDFRWLQRRLQHASGDQPRAFCGVPIEVEGARWGVLVVDSTGERIEESARSQLEFSAKALSTILEGVLV